MSVPSPQCLTSYLAFTIVRNTRSLAQDCFSLVEPVDCRCSTDGGTDCRCSTDGCTRMLRKHRHFLGAVTVARRYHDAVV